MEPRGFAKGFQQVRRQQGSHYTATLAIDSSPTNGFGSLVLAGVDDRTKGSGGSGSITWSVSQPFSRYAMGETPVQRLNARSKLGVLA